MLVAAVVGIRGVERLFSVVRRGRAMELLRECGSSEAIVHAIERGVEDSWRGKTPDPSLQGRG
jgi:hypothetical protein